MATYLLTWNPNKWNWTDIQEAISEVNKNGFSLDTWSTGSTRKIHRGDRLFLMRVGSHPRGIFASGWSESEVFDARPWNKESKSITTPNIKVKFDTILDPERKILMLEDIEAGIPEKGNWTPQASGMTIPESAAEKLEGMWEAFLGKKTVYPDEISPLAEFPEGQKKRVTVNAYERNNAARDVCINKYGAICSVCGIDFGQTYGEIGRGFIHIHHLKPISEIGKQYSLDPIQDLRPVCPNCHAMLHTSNPTPLTIEALKAILQKSGTMAD